MDELGEDSLHEYGGYEVNQSDEFERRIVGIRHIVVGAAERVLEVLEDLPPDLQTMVLIGSIQGLCERHPACAKQMEELEYPGLRTGQSTTPEAA